VVIDDFYTDPEAIRQLALSLEFRRHPGATYPGGEAVAVRDWSSIRAQLRAHIDEAVDFGNPKPYVTPQGLFRLAFASDEKTRLDGVHQDAQRWSAVIYLSEPQHCRGGVAFFRHKQSGRLASDRELEHQLFGHLAGEAPNEARQEVLKYLRDMTHWEEVSRIDMRYNRAVLLMAQCFHMSVGVFGDKPENGRLTQHFEFYGEKDGIVYGE
jgi:hypothetical protein